MKPKNCTVAVLGGGISGAAACLRLTQSGLEPLWVAKSLDSVDKVGEYLSPAARPLLAQLGAEALLDKPDHRAANSILSAWGSEQLIERNSMIHLEGSGTVLNRSVFERDLQALADSSVAQRLDDLVVGADWDDGVWQINLQSEESVQAGFLIDATGRSAKITHSLASRFRADKLAALCVFLEQDVSSEIEPTPTTLIETSEEGWWYATLLADGRLTLNYYTDPDLLPKDVTRELSVFGALVHKTRYISRWVDEAGFKLASCPQLASAGTTWIAPGVGQDWIAIGDAVAAFDPLSSHGMSSALWTAISGADAVVSYLEGDPSPLSFYAKAVIAGIENYRTSRDYIYSQEKRFENSVFWQRRRSNLHARKG